MDPTRWRQVRELVADLLPLSPEARQALLTQHRQGDPDLAGEAESLLEQEHAASGFLSGSALSGWSEFEPAAEAAPFVAGDRLDRYRVLSSLGRGGMGRVYLAERDDGVYRQEVAIKVLHSNLPGEEPLRRFAIERQILADLEHPDIARLIDGGALPDGRPYMVMEAINGLPITEHCQARALPLADRLRLLARVARAVHFAHQNLVIHRDLKPSNILVTGDGAPKLLDFGIAKLVAPNRSHATPTATHFPWTPLTPEYASPEQLLGEPVSTATDVYALGVVLYELLTGSRPFLREVQPLPELLRALRESEPPRPSTEAPLTWARELRGDLDNIVTRALAPEPKRRYESAAALASDLESFLAHQPVRATPPSWLYRTGRWLERHRTAAAATALVAAAVVAGGVWASWERQNARQRGERILAFSRQADEMEALARLSALHPFHDVRPDQERISAIAEVVSAELPSLEGELKGAAYWALGRGAISVHRYTEAKEHFERAAALGFRRPEVFSALGYALSHLYREALAEAAQAPNAALIQAMRQRASAELGEPALQALTAGRGERERGGPALEALIAFQQEDFELARRLAAEMVMRAPLLWSSRLLESDIEMARGMKLGAEGQVEAAEAAFAAAAEPIRQTLRIARSDVTAYTAECNRQLQRLELSQGRAGTSPALLSEAEQACDQALALDSNAVPALRAKARLLNIRAQVPTSGGDPRELLAASRGFADRSLAALPNDPAALHLLGQAWSIEAQWSVRTSHDPSAAVEAGVAALEKAIARRPWFATAHGALGTLRYWSAYYDELHGRDAEPGYLAATRSYEQELELAPTAATSQEGLARAHVGLASVRGGRGDDPTPDYERAIAYFERAIELDPSRSLPLYNLGLALTYVGNLKMGQGLDPTEALSRAEVALRRSLEMAPQRAAAHMMLATGLSVRAAYELDQGKDPAPVLARGREAIANSARLNPKDSYNSLINANLELVAARWALLRGLSPETHFTNARALLTEGRNLDPQEANLMALSSETDWREARWRHQRRAGSGRALAQSALLHALNARRLRPALVDALAAQGGALLALAEAEGSPVLAGEAATLLERTLIKRNYIDAVSTSLLAEARRLSRYPPTDPSP